MTDKQTGWNAENVDNLLRRAEDSLEWMVKVLKWQHDDCGISPGNYSDELTEAAAVLEALKEVNSET